MKSGNAVEAKGGRFGITVRGTWSDTERNNTMATSLHVSDKGSRRFRRRSAPPSWVVFDTEELRGELRASGLKKAPGVDG